MKNKQDILSEMLKKHYPKAFAVLEQQIDVAIANNKNKIESLIPNFEFAGEGDKWTLDQTRLIARQFREYLTGLGFYAVSVSEYPLSSPIQFEGKYYRGLSIQVWIVEDAEIRKIFEDAKKAKN